MFILTITWYSDLIVGRMVYTAVYNQSVLMNDLEKMGIQYLQQIFSWRIWKVAHKTGFFLQNLTMGQSIWWKKWNVLFTTVSPWIYQIYMFSSTVFSLI